MSSAIASRQSVAPDPLQDSSTSRSRLGLIPPALIFGLLLLCYGPMLSRLVTTWMVDEDLTHAPLVPIVFVMMVWYKQAELARIEARPSFTGLAVMLAAAVFACVGPPELTRYA